MSVFLEHRRSGPSRADTDTDRRGATRPLGTRLLLAVLAAVGGAAAVSAAGAGDPERGEQVFARHCQVCHALAAAYHKEGPSLAGIYGRAAGTQPFFPRYVGLKNVDIVWTEETLDAWLTDPRAFLGGRDTAMTFKLTDAGARADIIAYLKTDP